jgi:hydrocephalus-inducing protein
MQPPLLPQIVNGPKYNIQLAGCGYKPKLDLSFHNHDFGPCTIWQQGMEPVTVQLRARNDDKQVINFDVRYDNKEHFTVDCAPTVLQPGETKMILVTFRPRLVQPYAEVVPLHINGLYTINVTFKGERSCCRGAAGHLRDACLHPHHPVVPHPLEGASAHAPVGQLH